MINMTAAPVGAGDQPGVGAQVFGIAKTRRLIDLARDHGGQDRTQPRDA